MSIRQLVEEAVKLAFRKLGIPEEHARVVYGRDHPLRKP